MTGPTHPTPTHPTPTHPPSRVLVEYADAYVTAYRWLFRVCPPWRWLLSSAFWPGSPADQTLRALKGRVA